jgi:ADP-dependent NAD(P)H-hydrate dehydratase / NAD(P)H-hydrate epimerase
MKVFSANQFKKWDQYTISNKPISSADLMENAAKACIKWLEDNMGNEEHFMVFCGVGNNGGDGLAIARMLHLQQCTVEVYVVGNYDRCTKDFSSNYDRLQDDEIQVTRIESAAHFPNITGHSIIIDAIFGTGLNQPPEGIYREIIQHINRTSAPVVSIDMPSGLPADESVGNNACIRASHTLSFQANKKAFLIAENAGFTGQVHILDIGLMPEFEKEEASDSELLDKEMMRYIVWPRNAHTHKGDYGHAAIITGSKGLMGASILMARGCLRSGAGKLTCLVPECGYNMMQASAPEAMVKTCGEEYIAAGNVYDGYTTIGIGPGLGIFESHVALLQELFLNFKKPMVIDADALNIIAKHDYLLEVIPASSILTPHQKEFERLFGKSANDFDRLQLALTNAAQHKLYIILKGHHTFIACPNGKGYFNNTGNPGMATGGSGDVLTGIITGLLAQGYSPKEAALSGVYLHGLAGDLAAAEISEQALIAGDIPQWLGKAILEVQGGL